MKRILLLLLTLLVFVSFAEGVDEAGLRNASDITSDLETAGSSSRILLDEVPEGSETRFAECTTGTSLVKAKLALVGKSAGSEEWEEAVAWFEGAMEGISGGITDTEELLDKLSTSLDEKRSRVSFSDDIETPLWADEALKIVSIEVESASFQEMKTGDSGDNVTYLQKKLITLGFLTGSADGQYGPMTAAAVSEVQTMMQERETERIAAYIAQCTDGDDEDDMIVEEGFTSLEEEITYSPMTSVTGVADARTLMWLYSDEFPIADRELTDGKSGLDVTRLQRRLISLGYMGGEADGVYGTTTSRGVLMYQYYNGMEQTGVADIDLQLEVFSDAAKGPDNPMLMEGSSGDDVKELQSRLKYLGFMKGDIDGDYGEATTEGVKNLQTYMRQREMDALLAEQNAASGIYDDAEDMVLETVHATEEDVDMSKVTIAVNGIADPLLLDAFYSDDFPVSPGSLQEGDKGLEVERLQRRLQDLEYLYTAPDGDYGSATATAVTAFQKRNGLTQDGQAGNSTFSVLYSSEAKKALKPYELKVDTSKQRVYAYAPDSNDEYTILVRTMKCSTGLNATPTPKGTFQNGTGPGARWHYFKKFGCWAQYAYTISGDVLFHSVLYSKKDGPVTKSSVYNLGRKASHGCVRLSVEDAKWIWSNCPRNTKVTIY